MKRFLKSILLFIPFALIIYVLLVIMGGFYAPHAMKNLYYPIGINHMNIKIEDARSTKNVDILFVGSSHAERGFDGRVFERYGFKCFNLGTSAQTPIQTEMLLNRYLDKMNPKIVIYDVYPGIFTNDGVEAALYIVANDRNDLYSTKMALNTNNIRLYNTLIYAFYRDFFHKNDHLDSSEFVSSEGRYIKGGGIEKDSVKYFKPSEYKNVHQSLAYVQKQFNCFEETMQKLKQKNIAVYLVQTPSTAIHYNTCPNNRSFDEYMHKQGKYINFNNMIDFIDTLHFYDKDHLNKPGVEIYNKLLIQTLFGLH